MYMGYKNAYNFIRDLVTEEFQGKSLTKKEKQKLGKINQALSDLNYAIEEANRAAKFKEAFALIQEASAPRDEYD